MHFPRRRKSLFIPPQSRHIRGGSSPLLLARFPSACHPFTLSDAVALFFIQSTAPTSISTMLQIPDPAPEIGLADAC